MSTRQAVFFAVILTTIGAAFVGCNESLSDEREQLQSAGQMVNDGGADGTDGLSVPTQGGEGTGDHQAAIPPSENLAQPTKKRPRKPKPIPSSERKQDKPYLSLSKGSMVFKPALEATPISVEKRSTKRTPARPIKLDPKPEYTKEARRKDVQGILRFLVHIDSTGAVTKVNLINRLGHGLDEAAELAIKQWRYAPATIDGRPISSVERSRIEFKLEDSSEQSEQVPE